MPALRAATMLTRHQHLGLTVEWVAREIRCIRVDCHELQRYRLLGTFSVSQSDSCIRVYCRRQRLAHRIASTLVPVEKSHKPRESGTRGFAKTPSSDPRRGHNNLIWNHYDPLKKQWSLTLSTEFAPSFVPHFSALTALSFVALVVFQHHKSQARHTIKTLSATKNPTFSLQRRATGIFPYYPVKSSATGDFRLSASWDGVFIPLCGLQTNLCK